ncbi:MAG: protein kinase [Deltaproteobacteria bacterium]|nr:protein kinase [Deltaproteobacteria bacterium]MBN2672621.1 protein kinase [Deltaproteobacteria bacterium]
MSPRVCNRSSSDHLLLLDKTGTPIQFNSKYVLGEPICEDANGPLYRGKIRQDNRDVAIRFFSRDSKPLADASPARTVSISQILQVSETGNIDHGIPFAVLEPPRGTSLDSLLRVKKTLPLKTSLQIALHVSLAIRFLHRQNIVHGHVNTQNIFIKRTQHDTLDVQLLHHRLDGKPCCINSPENLSPNLCTTNGSLCEEDDVWAIGIVLYQMIYGNTPFRGDSCRKIYQRIQLSPLRFPKNADAESEVVTELLKQLLTKNADVRLCGSKLIIALKSLLATQRVEPDATLNKAKRVSALAHLQSSNDLAETRRSIDTRVLAKHEHRKAKHVKVFQRAVTLLTKKKARKATEISVSAATMK